jgi:hypothetical protein
MIFNRKNKPIILIETKDYTTNIKQSETDKFIRDVTENDCNGIFISQSSGIIGKDNFQIDIHNKNILIYIHNGDYDVSKIKMAINAIDLLSDKIINLKDKNINIPNESLKEINLEYQRFIVEHTKLINQIKESNKKTLELCNNLRFPNLEHLLNDHYSNNKKTTITCKFCKLYETDNLKSMARHHTACKKVEVIIDTNSSEDSNKSLSKKNIPKNKHKKKEINM